MLQPIRGTAGRYLDTDTGETISRRQAEKIKRPTAIVAREQRYTERKQERVAKTAFIPRDRMAENKRYWMQRFAEQYGGRHDERYGGSMSDTQALAIARQPGSEFNRLWSAAQAQGFEGGEGSAWDALTYRAGARGGVENESERNKYLAVIAWYMRNDNIGKEAYVDRGKGGKFNWPGYADNKAS